MLTPQEVAEKHLTAVKGGDPCQMAEDYADDAVLVRGNDVYTGKEEIFDYFSGVPERLGSGVIEFLKLEVNGTSAYFSWQITDDQQIISGKDVLTIKHGLIQHQEVTLLTKDF